MHYWIQKDIAQAIVDTNAPFQNVMNAPVKNLLKIAIAPYRTAAGVAGADRGGGADYSTPSSDMPAEAMGMGMERQCPSLTPGQISSACHRPDANATPFMT